MAFLNPIQKQSLSEIIYRFTLQRQKLWRHIFSFYGANPDVVENIRGVSPLTSWFVQPFDGFDFSYGGAYSSYNWELFYHIPFMLARHLSQNQRFAEAQQWFHYIFDPTYVPQDVSQEPWSTRVWQVRPFFEYSKNQLAENMTLLTRRPSTLSKSEQVARKNLLDQIEAWRNDPYNPFTIGRIRLEAHMKAVVMAYLDNLIAWGDHLLREDTRESINQATHLYILAGELLGERPQELSHSDKEVVTINGREVRTFNDVSRHLDDFSNALVVIEEQLEDGDIPSQGVAFSELAAIESLEIASSNNEEPSPENINLISDSLISSPLVEPPDDNPVIVDLPLANPIPPVIVPTLLFCIPENDKLVGYWDVVEDRLFKIRHCMNLAGVIRQLPLIEPPIDPELLIRARATGADLDGVFLNLGVPLPHYRFQILAAKVTEIVNEVKGLGNALLSALEKKDAEELNLLRSKQEIHILELTEQVFDKQLEEFDARKEALLESRKLAKHRYHHYEFLLSRAGESFQDTNISEEITLREISANLVMDNTLAQGLSLELEIPRADLSPIASSVKELFSGAIKKVRKKIFRKVFRRFPLIRKVKNLGKKATGKIKDGISIIKGKIFSDFDELGDISGNTSLVVPESIKPDLSLRLLEQERGEIESMAKAQSSTQGASNHRKVAALWQAIPQLSISIKPLGMGAGTSVGGSNRAAVTSAQAEFHQSQSSQYGYHANLESKVAQHILRENDWTLQSNLAALEMMQIDKQLVTADIQIAILEKEILNHRQRVKDVREVDDFMRDKFTSNELYSWMVKQISDVYLQSYQLALDLAKSVERTFQHELGIESANYIRANSWKNLKQGLLAGEKLYLDLKRMEAAYLEEHRREFELTKHISLAALNPLALLQLKEIGRCEIEVPEEIFDLDYPGHYFRRIKSVSITIPAVTGPYTTLSCTLRLLRSSIRRQTTLLNGAYTRDMENEDPRFSDSFGAIQSIATSSGQNDSGLFELNFRDDRYLPFEGAGAISRWQLEMPDEFRQFDYDSISDVILHMNYMAKEGGQTLANGATEHLSNSIDNLVTGTDSPGLHQSFSMRHDFPTEFHRFLYPANNVASQALTLNLSQNYFPYMFRDRAISIDQVHLFVQATDEFIGSDVADSTFTLTCPGGESTLVLGSSGLVNTQGLSYALVTEI